MTIARTLSKSIASAIAEPITGGVADPYPSPVVRALSLATKDGGYWVGSGWIVGLGSNWGDKLGTGSDDIGYIQFDDINIPNTATITSADLGWTVQSLTSPPVGTANIYGEDADNASPVLVGDPNTWIKTTALAALAAYTGAGPETESITGIIAEIIARAGWLPGNSINLLIVPTGAWGGFSSIDMVQLSPTLTINFTVP